MWGISTGDGSRWSELIGGTEELLNAYGQLRAKAALHPNNEGLTFFANRRINGRLKGLSQSFQLLSAGLGGEEQVRLKFLISGLEDFGRGQNITERLPKLATVITAFSGLLLLLIPVIPGWLEYFILLFASAPYIFVAIMTVLLVPLMWFFFNYSVGYAWYFLYSKRIGVRMAEKRLLDIITFMRKPKATRDST